jgi:hypothetical protein
MQPQANFVGGLAGCSVVFPFDDLQHSGLGPEQRRIGWRRKLRAAQEAQCLLESMPVLKAQVRAVRGESYTPSHLILSQSTPSHPVSPRPIKYQVDNMYKNDRSLYTRAALRIAPTHTDPFFKRVIDAMRWWPRVFSEAPVCISRPGVQCSCHLCCTVSTPSKASSTAKPALATRHECMFCIFDHTECGGPGHHRTLPPQIQS